MVRRCRGSELNHGLRRHTRLPGFRKDSLRSAYLHQSEFALASDRALLWPALQQVVLIACDSHHA